MNERMKSPCVGALLRKRHAWPPPAPPLASAARSLSAKREWQPLSWKKGLAVTG
jgi:hypothetical protein